MTRVPDRGRQAVYDTEESVTCETTWAEPLTFPEAVSFAGAVTSSAWWANHVGQIPDVEASRSDACSSAAFRDGSKITLAPRCCTPWIVVHELAHIAAAVRSGPTHGHDSVFRGVMVAVCAAALDYVLAGEITDAFTARGLFVADSGIGPPDGHRTVWSEWRVTYLLGLVGAEDEVRAPYAL